MELKKNKELATAAYKTADKLEKELEPFMAQNAITIVAPVKQYLENHLKLVDREIENGKLTPEIIEQQTQDEQQKIVEAAKRRLELRQARNENNAKQALEEAEKAAKEDKKADKKPKGKLVEFKGPKASVTVTGKLPAIDELTEGQKAALAAQGGGATSDTDELTEEQKAALAAQGGGAASDADELTEEQKAALAAQSDESDENQGDELTEEEKALLAAESGSDESTSTAQDEEVVKKTEKKIKGKAPQVSTQEPLI